MKTVIILIFALLMIFTSIAVYALNSYNYKNIYYATALDESYLKDLNLTFEPTNITPNIDKSKIRKIANKMLKESSIKPKGVYLEYGLITDKGTSVNIFSKDVLDANPALKEKTSISQIPVWLVTFKGLLPDDYKNNNDSQNNNLPGKQSLDITTTVIDAMSGKVLYGFGTGKRNN